MAAASNKRKRSKRRRARGESDLVRLGAVCVVVIIAALALATLLRPDKGYARAEPLLAALAGGAGLGVVALLLIGLLRRVALVDVRDRGSLWQATTAWPGMAIVVTLFVADAAGPHLVGAIGALMVAPVSPGLMWLGSCTEDLPGVGPFERGSGLVAGLDEREHLLGEVLGGVEVAVLEQPAGEDREHALDLV